MNRHIKFFHTVVPADIEKQWKRDAQKRYNQSAKGQERNRRREQNRKGTRKRGKSAEFPDNGDSEL